MATEDPKILEFSYLKVNQPLGEFYLASIPAKDLVEITFFDVRRVMRDRRDIEKYLGVQRELNTKRVKTIEKYIGSPDACFPTAIIIAVEDKCVSIDDDSSKMVLSNFISEVEEENVFYRNIARVLDGQHRLAGLEEYFEDQYNLERDFDINVSIFVDADISDQANIFSTVNLAQTKVNKSLVYDLYDLAKTRSPQKVCHNIAVTLDTEEGSPFNKMIKRLGVSTIGRAGETITQATFIEPLLKMVSIDPQGDREKYLRRKTPRKITIEELYKHPFQHMFVDEKDFELTDIIWRYFEAVKDKWPKAWETREVGFMLNRTNGYKALMRFLLYLYKDNLIIGRVPTKEQFDEIFGKVLIESEYFTTEHYSPGTAGESAMFKDLVNGGPLD